MCKHGCCDSSILLTLLLMHAALHLILMAIGSSMLSDTSQGNKLHKQARLLA